MTIELSLRRRASFAQYFAALWLTLAVALMVTTYFSLPHLAEKTLASIDVLERGAHPTSASPPEAQLSFFRLHVFGLVTLVLSVGAVSFGSYMLGRAALLQWERAGRFSGIADALCVAGANLGSLEKAATLFLPKTQLLSSEKAISQDQLKDLLELIKKLR